MADPTVAANLVETVWDDKFFVEWVRKNRFAKYMGQSVNSIIQVREDLTKKAGDNIMFELLHRLNSDGVEGNAALEGSEESLDQFGHAINVTTRRNGVVVTDEENQKTGIQLRNAAKAALRTWSMEKLRNLILDGFGAIATADGGFTKYSAASEGNKDTYTTNNSDRLLFGAVKSNRSAADHSASLANIDNTADKLDAEMVSLAKRMAKTADPHIRPVTVNEDEEWFVLFCNSLSFRDFKTDSTITQANREAWQRGSTNPLFTDGDLVWDGVLIREVPEIAILTGVGAGSIDVAPNYFCGAQCLGVAWAKRWKSAVNNTDYEFRKGVAIQANLGVEKLFFNTKANGLLTLFSAGVADS